MIAHGANIDARDSSGETLLHNVANRGSIKMLQMLLDHDAAIVGDYFEGGTPLRNLYWFMPRKDAVEISKILIAKYEWIIDASDSFGKTPLHYAVEGRRTDLVKLLVANKAEINEKDYYWGKTPLDMILGDKCLQYRSEDNGLVAFLRSQGAKRGAEIKDEFE